MQVVKLSPKDSELLEKFCRRCAEVGYNNNSSTTALKWGGQYDLPSPAEWWAVIIDGRIASISGCHQFESASDSLRCLFRSATLPEYAHVIRGISKTHMNSMPFSILLPEQIAWGKSRDYREFLITTVENGDASGHMGRTHRALELLAKQNIVECLGEQTYYHTVQVIWRLNVDNYLAALEAFRGARDINIQYETPIHQIRLAN